MLARQRASGGCRRQGPGAPVCGREMLPAVENSLGWCSVRLEPGTFSCAGGVAAGCQGRGGAEGGAPMGRLSCRKGTGHDPGGGTRCVRGIMGMRRVRGDPAPRPAARGQGTRRVHSVWQCKKSADEGARGAACC